MSHHPPCKCKFQRVRFIKKKAKSLTWCRNKIESPVHNERVKKSSFFQYSHPSDVFELRLRQLLSYSLTNKEIDG